MKVEAPNLWSVNTRDLMRVSSCDHCTRLSIARTLGVASVLERLAPEIEKERQSLSLWPKSTAANLKTTCKMS
jgi:uncharacterized protein